MSKHFTFSLFGLAFVVFFVWIIVAGTPLSRLNRGCAPIIWSGKALSAVVDVASDNAARKVWSGTAKTFQGCRFVLFKTFYQSEYERLQAEQAAAEHKGDTEKAPASAASTSPARGSR